ncbi:putative gustatory receptor 59d [Drosophila bipectinata]|uniref:putative gustatory receptor 59d n=1 Tax=Drosophila bipectinata TaxID=42026 RepID=UPI001C89F2C2|nr:putative gustatory receptor 59d [Drosophila bipectinata]
MPDPVKWCICIGYFYGRLTGVLNFEIDLKTGRTRVTNRANLYAALAQIVLTYFLVHQAMEVKFFRLFWWQANILHEVVYLAMAGFRLGCILISLVSRWLYRRHFIRLFHSFRCLVHEHPEITQCCRVGIVSKCFFSTALDALMLLMGLVMMWQHLTVFMVLQICSVSILTAVINVIITQYHVAIAIIRGRYTLLIRELGSIMAEAQTLVPSGVGVFVTRCCALADSLDELAAAQSNLQALTECLSKTYGLQILSMFMAYYLNFVGTAYLIFSVGKYTNITENWPPLFKALAAAYMVIFISDCYLCTYNPFRLLNSHSELSALLKQRSTLPPGLDPRLEIAFENFELNLARNPLTLSFFGAYTIDPASLFAVMNSLITNAILLIQYDVENY